MIARKMMVVAAAIKVAINISSSRLRMRINTDISSLARAPETMGSGAHLPRVRVALARGSCRLEVDHLVQRLDGRLADPLFHLPVHRQHRIAPGFAFGRGQGIDLHLAGLLDVLKRSDDL